VALRENNGILLVINFNAEQDVSRSNIFHVELRLDLRFEERDVRPKDGDVVHMNKEPRRGWQGAIKDAGVASRDYKADTDEPLRETVVPDQWCLFKAVNRLAQVEAVTAAIQSDALRNGEMNNFTERSI
jgi:hypothetical protein